MVMQLSEKKKLIAATVQHCADSWLQANPGGSQPQQASPEHAQQGREATKKDGSAARAACPLLHAGNGSCQRQQQQHPNYGKLCWMGCAAAVVRGVVGCA